MEKQPSVKHEKRSQKSSKKTPVKVVYISNPMKIKASPSEFRAVVQQLTGRYATFPPPHEFPGTTNKDNLNHQEQEHEEEAGCGVHRQEKWHRSMDAVLYLTRSDQVRDDIIITPQMLDGFSPLLPSDFGS